MLYAVLKIVAPVEGVLSLYVLATVRPDTGDAVLIGVSRIEQLDPIMTASKGGPLPQPVVEAFEQANDLIKMKSEYYLQYPYPKEGSPWKSRL